jgi:CelD/BcsL family acetyltransferase involved in cellulose biosynthesis
VNVVEINSLDEIDGAQWDELLEHCPDSTVFQTRQWLRAWLETVGRPEQSLKVLAAFQGARLVGFAPLVRASASQPGHAADRWQILGDDYSDYQTFLAWDGSQLIIERLLAAADACLPAGATLVLRDLPQFSALALHLAGKAANAVSGVRANGSVACPSLCVRTNPLGVARVLAKRGVIRHERSLARHGELSVQHLHAPAEIEQLLPDFFAQHIARWAGTVHPSLFLNPDNPRFYRAVTTRLGAAGGLLFTVVRVNGRIAAQHFGLRSGRGLLWYKPAFDVTLGGSSPGEVLLKRLIEFALSNDLDELDFTRGNEAFKSRFASTVAFNRHFIWHRRLGARLKARLLAGGTAALRRVRSSTAVPALPLGGAAAAAKEGKWTLLLDAADNPAQGNATPPNVATQVAQLLARRGVEVHRSLLKDWLARVGQVHDYSLIVPCSKAALEFLAALPEIDPVRARALLAPRQALTICNSHVTDLSSQTTDPAHRAVSCLYVHGKLAWYFTRESAQASEIELLQVAKRVLDAAQWHGFAVVTAERQSDGSLRLLRVSPELDDSLVPAARAGVDFPLGLWRIARGEPVGPQPALKS